MIAVLPSDGELVRQVRGGRDGAFRDIVERHERLVFGVAYAILRDRALAEDVAQEAFIAAWDTLDQLSDAERLRGWLAGIARNLARNAVRRRTRGLHAVLADLGPDAAPSPDDEAVARETQAFLRRSLEQVPELYREALVLFYIEDRSTRQVAAALGVSEDLARQRLARGRKALRAAASGELEAALMTLRPRGGFVAGVLVAVAASRASTASAGMVAGKGMVAAMSTNKIAMAVVVVGLIAGGAALIARRVDDRAPVAVPAHGSASVATEGAHPPPEQPPTRVEQATVAKTPKRLDTAGRDRLLANIRAARERRLMATVPPSASDQAQTGAKRDGKDDPSDEESEREVIREAMQELIPMVTECYDRALAEAPSLQGSLTVEFVIDGEPDVGGLVTDSHVVEADPGIDHQELRECVQETMYALEIGAPKHAAHDTIRYPFMFAPE